MISINKKRTALMVIDKQNGYFKPVPDNPLRKLPANSEQVLSDIDTFIDACRKNNIPIIWTKMIENIEDSPSVISEKMEDDIYRVNIVEGAESFEIAGEEQPATSDIVIVKKYYDAFAQTTLRNKLLEMEINTVVLVGGYASRCVLGTAYGANGNDFRVIVINNLIINQQRSADELPTFNKIIDAILGYSMSSEEFFNNISS